MEWVETTAKSVDEAKELALDQLGVTADDAEFDVLESPRPGLFGRVRGEARVRARVRPTPVRPKQERRRGRRNEDSAAAPGAPPATPDAAPVERPDEPSPARAQPVRQRRRSGATGGAGATDRPISEQGADMTSDDMGDGPQHDGPPPGLEPVDVERVRDAAVEFVSGLTRSFGFDTTVDAVVDGSDIEVRVGGESLGLLIGPGGRTLLGIQDLARVAAQRRLGDHDTRLRVDVAGYREKRRAALQSFADTVAEQVRQSGVARWLDAMPSADRKVLHDALAELDGVTSRSEGEEPNRRVVVTPT